MGRQFTRVLVTGGGGYVGALLVPRLLFRGYQVNVLDLFWYGEEVLAQVKEHPLLDRVKGDLRDERTMKRALRGCEAVIHLACVSNDPSFDLNPALGKSINRDSFPDILKWCREMDVERFIFASSSSVYGVSEAAEVTEEHPLAPLTDYSRYKAECETLALAENSPNFTVTVVRPATLCGYSPRQRLDLVANILTNHAVNRGIITVTGGPQKRPNLHVNDMCRLYETLLELPKEKISGKVWNVGFENHTVSALAELVKKVVEEEIPGKKVAIETKPTNDPRSYHISAKKIEADLGFRPEKSIEDAVRELARALRDGKLPNSMEDSRYFNIQMMKQLNPA